MKLQIRKTQKSVQSKASSSFYNMFDVYLKVIVQTYLKNNIIHNLSRTSGQCILIMTGRLVLKDFGENQNTYILKTTGILLGFV